MIHEDNQGAIALAMNVGYQARTKHIDIRYHYTREQIVDGVIELKYVASEDQIADFLTKGLSSKSLCHLMSKAGLVDGAMDHCDASGGVTIPHAQDLKSYVTCEDPPVTCEHPSAPCDAPAGKFFDASANEGVVAVRDNGAVQA